LPEETLKGDYRVQFAGSLVFATILSLDSFFAGSTYGIKDIQISRTSLLILTAATSLSLMFSMAFGEIVETFLNPNFSKYFGSLILFVVGLLSLFSTFKNQRPNHREHLIASFKIRPLGVVIKILKEPYLADADKSGAIDPKEAVLLGFALALDSLGAGFGAAAAGFDIYWTTLFVSLMSAFMLSLGVQIGKKYPCLKTNKIKYIPGALLIALAFLKVLFWS
jgi:putative sporulation protein YtaF